MYQISPRDFSKLNRAISNEIEKILLKFASDGKIKVIPDEKPSKPVIAEGEKRPRGRPRKIKSEEVIVPSEKRPRGRPRKIKTEKKPVDGPKRKRGRPRKIVTPEGE
jgi:hypothetical protein